MKNIFSSPPWVRLATKVLRMWKAIKSFVGSRSTHALLEIVIAFAACIFAYNSNKISKTSNNLMDRQILIEDATRQAAASAEVSAILDQINNYQTSNYSTKSLPSTILARIAAATQTIRPYRQPQSSMDNLCDTIQSPERGHLLAALVNMGLTEFQYIFKRSDFSYAVIHNTIFSDVTCLDASKFHNVCFQDISMERDTLPFADFSSSSLTGLKIKSCYFNYADFSGASLEHLEITSSNFQNADFRNCTIRNIDVDGNSEFLNARFSGAIVDSAFYEAIIKPLGDSSNAIKSIL